MNEWDRLFNWVAIKLIELNEINQLTAIRLKSNKSYQPTELNSRQVELANLHI